MNRSDEMDQEPTVLAINPPRTPTPTLDLSPPSLPSRCKLAMVQGSGPHLSDEIKHLLHQRLRIASIIALFPLLAFLIKNLLTSSSQTDGPDVFDTTLHGIVVVILAAIAALLWSTHALSDRMLRLLELVMFGSMAFFFANLQFHVYYPGKYRDWAMADHLSDVVSLGNTANNFRWFYLIVLYGMFIPNTWKRCAIVVGCMALIPIALMFNVCQHCLVLGPDMWSLQFASVVILSMGCAMAIFGSYRIHELHKQAHQARKLGQYQLHRKLGAGGMGEVYLGEHTLLKRNCAIKLIRPDQAGDPTTFHRFEREVQSMATLTHWNTVEIYDYGRTEDGTFYYVMEYLPGLSLQELVEAYGPLPPGRAIHFLRQLCAALREAHAIGLIHRDIKPSNVIACQRGGVHDVAKLLDFGLVQDVTGFASSSDNKLTVQGAILGSPNYISPEQARGKGHIDPRTDIYSLGALAYFLVTGQTPFVRETAMELLAAHMKDEVVPPRQLRPELPQDLEEVILMCLRKNPDERFADAESLDMALAACDAAGQWDPRQAKGWWHQDTRMAAVRS